LPSLALLLALMTGCSNPPPADFIGNWWGVHNRPNLGQEALNLSIVQPLATDSSEEVSDTQEAYSDTATATLGPFPKGVPGEGEGTPVPPSATGMVKIRGTKISLSFPAGPDTGNSGWRTAEVTATLKEATTVEEIQSLMASLGTHSEPAEKLYQFPGNLEYLEGTVEYSGTKINKDALPVMGGTYGPVEGDVKPMSATVDFTLIRLDDLRPKQ
jgi:hypothetical protein